VCGWGGSTRTALLYQLKKYFITLSLNLSAGYMGGATGSLARKRSRKKQRREAE
jgi:hypothetical protein